MLSLNYLIEPNECHSQNTVYDDVLHFAVFSELGIQVPFFDGFVDSAHPDALGGCRLSEPQLDDSAGGVAQDVAVARSNGFADTRYLGELNASVTRFGFEVNVQNFAERRKLCLYF